MGDVDIFIKMDFFISDLHRQIEDLHKEQYSNHHVEKTFTVYRGQGLSKAAFEEMIKINGGLMSFNNFLSISKVRDISLRFAHNALGDPDSVDILFVMAIDPSQSTASFAYVNRVSYFQAEDELLFSMRTIFCIHVIKSIVEKSTSCPGRFNIDARKR